jgi:D-alanyl-D-alanine carboxypeptidase/D-alanyl-D-alanine-endopeptidase (penicillin-binding protein 4)
VLGRATPIACLALACLPAPAGSATGALPGDVDRLVGALGPASGVLVVDLGSGATLLERRADEPRIPASTNKLFVTAAALRRLTPGARLPTSLLARGRVDARGVLHGDLALAGGGDPALGDDDLRLLARRVRGAGIQRVTGTVLADDTRFDTRRGGLRTAGRYDPDIGGAVSALMFGYGERGAGGVSVVPARRLQGHLRRLGVRLGRRPRRGTVRGPARLLGRVLSPTLGRLALEANTWSANLYAEVLVKALGAYGGAGGTTRAGLRVVERELAGLGLRVLPRMVDGSGLDRGNAATPRQLVEVLRRMDRAPQRRAWSASLARMGRTGTLRARGATVAGTASAAVGRCAGKTGSIAGVSALAGICRTTSGGRVAFALMSNGVGCEPCVKRVEDRIVARLARAAVVPTPLPAPVAAAPPGPDDRLRTPEAAAAASATRIATPGLLPRPR